jgi:hypothetical protein
MPEQEHWSSPNGCHEDCPACEAERAKADREQRIYDLARELFDKEGELDIEEHNTSTVSEGDDNGAYVRFWKWVPFNGTPLDKEADPMTTELSQ